MTAPTYLSTYDAWGNFTSSLDTIQSFPSSEQSAAANTSLVADEFGYVTINVSENPVYVVVE